jgi:pyruvate carboxylase
VVTTSSDGCVHARLAVCQVLVRGANAVGYTSYPDNTVEHFVTLAAKRGIDLFRIFDCFNDVGQMRTSINAVLKVPGSPQAHSKHGETCHA